jgi:hypothetical protein
MKEILVTLRKLQANRMLMPMLELVNVLARFKDIQGVAVGIPAPA